MERWPEFNETSRERPKSAPYLRLKSSKRTSKRTLFYSTGMGKRFPFFSNFFKVSGKSHSAKKVKEGPFGIFRTSILLQNRKQLKGDPLETLKKVLQSRNNTQKNFVKGETRTHVLLLGGPQKILINLYACRSASRSSVAASVSRSQRIKLIKSATSLVFKKSH